MDSTGGSEAELVAGTVLGHLLDVGADDGHGQFAVASATEVKVKVAT